METLPAGKTAIRFYVSEGEASLDSIVRCDIDKKALQALTDLPFTEDGYTDKSWADYAAAKAEANRVLNDDGATVQEVQDAYEALSNAIDGLVVMVNLGELVTAMEGKLCLLYTS